MEPVSTRYSGIGYGVGSVVRWLRIWELFNDSNHGSGLQPTAGNVFRVVTVQLIVKWVLMYAGMHSGDKTLLEALVWGVVFVRQFVRGGC